MGAKWVVTGHWTLAKCPLGTYQSLFQTGKPAWRGAPSFFMGQQPDLTH